MIIDSSRTEMASARAYQSRSSELKLFGWAQRQNENAVSSESERFRNLLNRYSSYGNGDVAKSSRRSMEFEQLRQQMLYIFLQRLHAIFHPADYGSAGGGSGSYDDYSYEAYAYEEHEETSYSAAGTVKCADGREISFNIDLSMSRSFSMYYERAVRSNPLSVPLCDPLIINLNGSAAGFSDQKIRFDLDADGTLDEIPCPAGGSAFLSLDLNEDGRINDGSELFGTKSGDGFRDLAHYDSDGNGWIDEADPVFEKLRIFVCDENGNEKLYRLKDKGVGAICLSSADTDFDLRDTDNNTYARIRKSGVFLYENGTAGTLQHVDLAKRALNLRA